MDDVRKLKEAADALIGIVEGINGAMTHGTWRAEKSNLRMKDTDEWVRFYNATRSLTPASDGRAEGLREAAGIAGECERQNGPLSNKGLPEHYRRGLEAGAQAIKSAILARAAELEGKTDE
jgi:hypothetical protein